MFSKAKIIAFAIGFLLPVVLLPQIDIVAAPKKTYTFKKTYTYKPPKRLKKARFTSVAAGARGCVNGEFASSKLRLFIPDDHVGLTASSHPTFFWYVSTKSKSKVLFTLVDLRKAEPIIEMQTEVTETGVKKLQMPAHLPPLEQGITYRWTVAIICNEKRPSEDIYAYSWIERVPEPVNLRKMLTLVNSNQRAAVYAEEGIWYDTLAEAYNYNSNSQVFFRLVDTFNQN